MASQGCYRSKRWMIFYLVQHRSRTIEYLCVCEYVDDVFEIRPHQGFLRQSIGIPGVCFTYLFPIVCAGAQNEVTVWVGSHYKQ